MRRGEWSVSGALWTYLRILMAILYSLIIFCQGALCSFYARSTCQFRGYVVYCVDGWRYVGSSSAEVDIRVWLRGKGLCLVDGWERRSERPLSVGCGGSALPEASRRRLTSAQQKTCGAGEGAEASWSQAADLSNRRAPASLGEVGAGIRTRGGGSTLPCQGASTRAGRSRALRAFCRGRAASGAKGLCRLQAAAVRKAAFFDVQASRERRRWAGLCPAAPAAWVEGAQKAWPPGIRVRARVTPYARRPARCPADWVADPMESVGAVFRSKLADRRGGGAGRMGWRGRVTKLGGTLRPRATKAFHVFLRDAERTDKKGLPRENGRGSLLCC